MENNNHVVAEERDTKRLLAEVPEDFFWEVKRVCAESKMKQKDLVFAALRQLMLPEYDLSNYTSDPELLAKFKSMGIE